MTTQQSTAPRKPRAVQPAWPPAWYERIAVRPACDAWGEVRWRVYRVSSRSRAGHPGHEVDTADETCTCENFEHVRTYYPIGDPLHRCTHLLVAFEHEEAEAKRLDVGNVVVAGIPCRYTPARANGVTVDTTAPEPEDEEPEEAATCGWCERPALDGADLCAIHQFQADQGWEQDRRVRLATERTRRGQVAS